MIDPTTSPIRRRLLCWARDYGWRYWNESRRECIGPRDNLWFAIALLLSGETKERDLGQSLLGTTVLGDSTHSPATVLAILKLLGDRLTPKTTAHLESLVAPSLVGATEHCWHDGNVNHPLAAWSVLILGGEHTGDKLAVDLGIARLHHLRRTTGDRRHVFHRQSSQSEYNSPTYTALNLWFLALIAECAEREEARTISRFLEERLWLDVALHYHAPTQQFSGPHSRAYLEDSLGGFSGLHCTLAAALENDLYLDPNRAWETGHASALVQNSLAAIIPYHLPDQARQLALHKPLPTLVRLNTYGESYHENSASSGFDDEVFPGGWSGLTSFQTAEFSLGTATRPYVNAGQADAFVIRMRRAETIQGPDDVRSMICRGVFNDSRPAQPNLVQVTGGRTDATYLYEEGRTAVLQHENRAIVLYRPKCSGRTPFTAFRVDLIISPAVPFAHFLADQKAIDRLPASLPAGSRILFRDYNTCGVIVPLTPAPQAGPNPITIQVVNGLLTLSIHNHHGEPVDPSSEDLLKWRNGFYCEIWPREAFGGPAGFREHLDTIKIEDTMRASGLRSVEVLSGDDKLRLVHDPRSEHNLEQTVNGLDNRIDHFQAIAMDCEENLITEGTLYGQEAWMARTTSSPQP